MERNLKLMFIILACTLIFVATESTQASPGAKIAIEPAEVRDIPLGEKFSVNVTVKDATELYGWQANITFNPQILNVESVAEGSFLKLVNETVFLKKIDNTGGSVLLSSTFYPPFPEHGATGSGSLVQVTFTVKGSGASSLHFEKDGTKLRTVIGDSVGYITDFSTTDASFRNAAERLQLWGIPLEFIAGAVVVVIAIGVSAFLLRRRKEGPIE